MGFVPSMHHRICWQVKPTMQPLGFFCSALLLLAVVTELYAHRLVPPFRPRKQQVQDSPETTSETLRCLASAEANRSSLTDLLAEVQRLYFYQLHPERIYELESVTPEDIRQHFRPYDPSPDAIKRRTDEAMELRRRLDALQINTRRLKLRERKAIHVASDVLLSLGWEPYSQDYYSGDWLLGPNMFCWEPVCQVFNHLQSALPHFKPQDLTQLERLKDLLEQYNQAFDRYVENWRLGERTGYRRTFRACKAAVHVVKYQFYRGIAMNGESGIYNERFANTLLKSGFFKNLPESVNNTWEEKYQQSVVEYFKQSLVQNIAKPVIRMLRYLEHEYLCNCPNLESTASGLGRLPLHYVPIGGQLSLKRLPTGERLSGPETYKKIMRLFTRLEITPPRLREKAVTRLNEMYRKAVDVAKLYTEERSETVAVKKFKEVLRRSDMWFNSQPFPSSESGDDAFIKCRDPTSAQEHCPERWNAMQKWVKNTIDTMTNNIGPVIEPLFYRSGPKKTVPDCTVEVSAWFEPYASYHAYGPGSEDCKYKARQVLPFFMDRFGPKWTEFTTTAHEQLPGHHLETQSYTEHFEDTCQDPIHWLAEYNYFPGFTEGWATYIEYELIPQDTNLYSDTSDKEVLLQKYGMIYYQLLAALRVIVDIDLNYYQKRTSYALHLYKQYVWEDNTDQARKDILRSQSLPGLVTSYMIGQMEISRVRDIAERELGREFDLKDFHYEVLRQGEFPLRYLEEHIRAYIACKKNPVLEECEEF